VITPLTRARVVAAALLALLLAMAGGLTVGAPLPARPSQAQEEHQPADAGQPLEPADAEAAFELAAASTPTPEPTATSLPPGLRPGAAPRPARALTNPYAAPGAFRKAQFHLHTANSFDGKEHLPPAAVARAFKAAGYGFVVFTDHDTASNFAGLNDATFVAGTGYESTGADGHIGALFVSTVVDARLPAQQRINAIRRAGGLAVLNHPDYEVGFRAQQLTQLADYQFLEIYNHITTPANGRLAENMAQNLEKWRQLLNARGRERPVWGLGVSDAHDGSTGGGWTVVKTAEVSLPALREAMLRGSMYASTGADFRSIDVLEGAIVVEPLESGRIRFVNQDGTVVREEVGSRATYRPADGDRWVRVELEDERGGRAWSQPLWAE
jgi:hypothetical protein